MMPARLAYPFFYREATRNCTEESRLAIDEILGDPTAASRRNKLRMDSVAAAGFEVG